MINVNRKNAIITVLFILLVLSVSTSFHIYQQQQRIIDVQEDIIEKLIGASDTAKVGKQTFFDASDDTTCANIVAVRSDNYQGVIGKVYVEIKEGAGGVLVNTNPFVEPTTQYSIREAVKVAKDFTDMNISNKNILISFDINGTLMGGPSAGAAIAAATIAALEGKKVRQDVAISGTIEEDGYIGLVDAVFEKAVVAEKKGMRLFLVPNGQIEVIHYERKVGKRKIFGFPIEWVYYMPEEIDLAEYMAGNMDVEEVSTIDDVVAYMILS
ncbi:Archaeal Lon protease [ANME-1 cluster archaeon GoMg3.2]|nr:Archaeal Lon protease [ANME-1 cluster archaeon GoMg3.2]